MISTKNSMVVVGSCGGTDSGTSASAPSYPVFPLSLNAVIKACKASNDGIVKSFYKLT